MKTNDKGSSLAASVKDLFEKASEIPNQVGNETEEEITEGDFLVKCLLDDKFDPSAIANRLKSVDDEKIRIPYHVISEFVYMHQDENNKIEWLTARIRTVKQSCKEKRQREILDKMLDHIKLAGLQMVKFSEILSTQREYIQKEKEDIEEARHDNNAQVVSILAIFTAAAFVLFGVSGLFDLLRSPRCSLGKIAFGVTVYGVMMLIVLFVLYWFVKKLVNPPKRQEK